MERAKPSNGSLKQGVCGLCPWKLYAVWFLKYQNLRFKAHLMNFQKKLIKCIYIIEAEGVVGAIPQKVAISCVFVAAPWKL